MGLAESVVNFVVRLCDLHMLWYHDSCLLVWSLRSMSTSLLILRLLWSYYRDNQRVCRGQGDRGWCCDNLHINRHWNISMTLWTLLMHYMSFFLWWWSLCKLAKRRFVKATITSFIFPLYSSHFRCGNPKWSPSSRRPVILKNKWRMIFVCFKKIQGNIVGVDNVELYQTFNAKFIIL